MQYLLLLYSEEGAWNKMPEAAQQEGLKNYMAYGEALRKAGVYVGSNRLRDTSGSTRVKVADGKTKVQDGPYADKPGYDFVFQGLGGLMSITGERDDRARAEGLPRLLLPGFG